MVLDKLLVLPNHCLTNNSGHTLSYEAFTLMTFYIRTSNFLLISAWIFVFLLLPLLEYCYLFKFLCYFWQHGSVYKLAFGPKAFVVVSDPIVARHVLRENAFSYDKVCLTICFDYILQPMMKFITFLILETSSLLI